MVLNWRSTVGWIGIGVFLQISGGVSISAWSVPKTEVLQVHGFDVHFVDVGVGDSMAVCFYTPYGTFHDQFEKMGRAHLLEHILFTGTTSFPGHHTFDEMLKPAGAHPNAYTAYGNTFYYVSGPLQERGLLLKALLAMLTGLEWNPTSYENERGIVINEIAVEDNKKAGHAIQNMSLVELLPKEHPWARPLFGDLQSLLNLSIDDLKASYLQAYAPGVVRVAVIGNFSNPNVAQDVRTLVSQILDAQTVAKDRARLSHLAASTLHLQVPSLFSAATQAPESLRRLYIQTDHLRQGLILLEAPEANVMTLDLLSEYLSLSVPGTLFYRLQTELGWVSEISLMPVHFENKSHLYLSYDMTEEGVHHRTEINEMFFRALHALAKHGPDAEILQLLKDQLVVQVQRAGRSVDDFLHVIEIFLRENVPADQVLKKLSAIPSSAIQQLAAQFRPDQALYVSSGPAIEGMSYDERFDRKYRIDDNTAEFERYMTAFFQGAEDDFRPRLRRVSFDDLPSRATVAKFEETKPLPWLSDRWVLDFRSDLQDYAASVRLSLPVRNVRTLVAVDLVLGAFSERYESELTYLRLKYQTQAGVFRSGTAIQLKSSGENRYAASALDWMMEQLKTFIPSSEELARMKATYINSHRQRYSSVFTAHLGAGLATALVDPLHLTSIQAIETASGLTESDVHALWAVAISKSDKQYTLVGDFDTSDFQRLYTITHQLSPLGLDQETRVAMANRSLWKESKQELRSEFPAPHTPGLYAAVRMYRGPALQNISESVALLALNEVITTQIVSRNREDQSLGYVHQSSPRSLDSQHHFLTFLGQAEGPQNLQQTINGWEFVLNEWRAGRVSDEKINDGISSVRNQLTVQINSAEDLLESYLQNQIFRGRARARGELLAVAEKLTVDDVRNAAEKYLLDPRVVSTEIVYGDCAKLLESVSD
jgi:predicted Zn-dependent peptidase